MHNICIRNERWIISKYVNNYKYYLHIVRFKEDRLFQQKILINANKNNILLQWILAQCQHMLYHIIINKIENNINKIGYK